MSDKGDFKTDPAIPGLFRIYIFPKEFKENLCIFVQYEMKNIYIKKTNTLRPLPLFYLNKSVLCFREYVKV